MVPGGECSSLPREMWQIWYYAVSREVSAGSKKSHKKNEDVIRVLTDLRDGEVKNGGCHKRHSFPYTCRILLNGSIKAVNGLTME